MKKSAAHRIVPTGAAAASMAAATFMRAFEGQPSGTGAAAEPNKVPAESGKPSQAATAPAEADAKRKQSLNNGDSSGFRYGYDGIMISGDRADAEFSESDHPRDKDGKFASGSGGGTSGNGVNGSNIVLEGDNMPNKPGSMAAEDHELKGFAPDTVKVYQKALASEPGISKDIMGMAKKMGVDLYGLDFSVKTGSSTARKIKKLIEEKPGRTEKEAIDSIGDMVRYTIHAKHDDLVRATNDAVANLKKMGYDILEIDNKWTKPNTSYKGIHINVAAPNGQQFELQVHSRLSQQTKDINHKYYEEERKTDTSQERKRELQDVMRKNVSSLPNPAGIETLKKYKKGE